MRNILYLYVARPLGIITFLGKMNSLHRRGSLSYTGNSSMAKEVRTASTAQHNAHTALIWRFMRLNQACQCCLPSPKRHGLARAVPCVSIPVCLCISLHPSHSPADELVPWRRKITGQYLQTMVSMAWWQSLRLTVYCYTKQEDS